TYAGYAVPKGTPAEIVQRLYDEARASLNGLRKSIEERGADLMAMSPSEAEALLRSEHARYGKLVRQLGIPVQ
ncbi:MAG: tripartite tricarboxylate transporter substrate binding protein, partial [Burkholderiales bacterium]